MSARAVDVLQGSFGKIRKIVATRIVAQPIGDIQQSYADVCNRDKLVITNPDKTTRPWTKADASHVGGFYDKGGNTIYVNNDLPILGYVHQLLHQNCAGGALDGIAEHPFVEGMTDRFAVNACQAAGLTNFGPPGYVPEMAMVDSVVRVVGEAAIRETYFNSPDSLAKVFETYQGVGTWAGARAAIIARDQAKLDVATAAPSEARVATVAAEKSAQIDNLIGGFFHSVSDADIDAIIKIVSLTRDDTEKKILQAKVQARSGDLHSSDQRMRLRQGCGL